MQDYTALISKWSTFNGSTLNTQQKLAAINATTILGSAAIQMVVPTYQIYNLIASSEFLLLDSTQRQNVRDILSMGMVDTSVGTNARARLASAFAASTQTMTALIALATNYDAPRLPWATTPVALGGGGLAGTVGSADLDAAGGLT